VPFLFDFYAPDLSHACALQPPARHRSQDQQAGEAANPRRGSDPARIHVV
jgi:hypothetical protein